MSVLTINAFPSTATITATYNEEIITGIGQVVIEANDSTVVSYTVEAQQCTSKSGTFTISGDMTESVALTYIGSVSVDTWVPSTGRDTFPTHIAMLGKGGWRSVESNDERDAIPSARREAGMSVYVTSTNKVYILDDDLVTWNELESGKVDDVRLHNVSVVDNKIANLETVRQVTTLPVEPLIAGEIVQYIGNTNANYTNGYFYKQTDRSTVYTNPVFTPLGEYEIDVSISDEDLNTFLNETVRQTDYPVVSGRFGYYQQTPNVLWYLSGTSGHRSDGFSYSNTPEGYAEQGFTVTPPIGPQQGLDYTVENTTTWVWERVDVQPNPTVYESFFRGKWDTWTDVPSDSSLYPEDYHESTIPTKNDYMVVTDASLYPVSEYNDSFYYETTGNGYAKVIYHGVTENINIAYGEHYIWNNMVDFYNNSSVCVPKNISGSAMKIGDTIYPNNSNLPRALSHEGGATVLITTSLVGSWRFRYIGDWTTDGKLGWNPEYQLENVLPIATDTEPGITKIYSTTGQNIDGSMTQKSISDALSNIKESFYRGRFNSWNSVPVNESGYLPEPGTQDQKTPTNNDFIVIIDPSDYASPEFTENFTFTGFNDPELGYGVSWTYLNVTYKVYGEVVTFGPGDCLRLGVPNGGLTAFRTTIVDGTLLYPNSGVRWLTGGTHNASATGSPGDYTGTWRFYYNGDWATDGKLGWFPQYQIENTLPIASPTEPGITKLYNTTGTNTDGAVDQNTVTSELGKRVLQVTEFPEASASNEGQLVQFIGTGGSGTTGWFYTSTQYQIPYSLTVEGDSDVTVTTYDTETFISQLSDTTVDSTTVFTYDGTDWKDSDSNVVDLTDWGITISGTPVNNSTITGTYVAPSTGYRWVQTDTQPTEEYHESFFRGPFGTWANVPGVGQESSYYADFYGNHKPGLTDYIVVANPEDYVPSETTQIIRLFTHSTGDQDASMDVTVVSTGQTYNYLHSTIRNTWTNIPDTDLQIAYQIGGGMNYSLRNTKAPMVVDGVWYAQNSAYSWIFSTAIDVPVNGYNVYRGMWRFAYTSNSWDSEGKNGWKPEYQIENVLPIADSQTLGIAKLYTTTGQNTDGSVTQKLVTDELGTKQDTLTAGSGISIDANNIISATFSESYFRGKFSTWNTVPTDYRNYYPDYTGSTKPTRTDYMVVEDPSGYIKPGDPITLYNEPMYAGTAYARFVFGATDITLNHNQVSQAGEAGIIIGTVGNQIKVTYNTPTWMITPLDVPIIVDGVEKPIGEVAYSWGYQNPTQETVQKELNFKGQGGYVGTWRFSYQSDNWDATGKNGWYPEYQIEDVLPIATDTDAGIMKLYTTTGSNTDGTMDQNSITTELGDLQDQIDDLKGLGRFLSVWNSSTGLPETNPSTSPYEYKSGDYYLVGTVSSSTNYRPDGLSYTTDVPSTVVETEEVHVNDVYIFDGAVWKLQANSQREYTFSGIAGDPYDNTNLGNALDAKQDVLTNASNAGEGIIIDDVTQEISTNNIVWRKW